MPSFKPFYLVLLLFSFILAEAYFVQGSRTQVLHPHEQSISHSSSPLHFKNRKTEGKIKRNSRIGSTAPTCTYNECRGCKYRCRAEQVPVEGNDPRNSAYHYRCVCHRP
ncbi:hypothetical protein SLE2022_249620 [Rubroshorea leprosula]|uniref:Stomagen C-terminal domain-containing protein n=1 Tax=Rubroshorea leprosula TaxID=152421 RepID=A0AAV5HAY6_9ROSI|nr:hypothetical protein SLEP1_g527 [Rubroshorea leprosula]